MKKIILFVVVVVCNLVSYSQYERMNWIFFIDGKIPFWTQFRGEFICFENSPNEKIIKFEYTIGDIIISTDDLNYIKENGDSIKKLTVKLYYREFTKKTNNLYNYSFYVHPSDFKLGYMVFNITNLNKKKGIFYLEYLTSQYDTVRYTKGHRVFTNRGEYPANNILKTKKRVRNGKLQK